MDARRTFRMFDAVLRLDPHLIIGDPPQNTFHTPSTMVTFLRDQCDIRSALIRRLHQETTDLGSVHNLFYPASSFIPPETLTMVLGHLYDSSPEPHRNRDFLSALLVCRQWHEAAIEVSRFWGTIRINNVTAVKTCLDRSGVAPLSLSLENAPLRDSDEVATLLKPHVHRIRSLIAEHEVSDELEDLLNSLDVSAPNLEVLRVSYLKDSRENADLAELFAGVMPSLHTLDLTRAWLPVNTSWTKNLHNLTLRNMVCTLSEILELLEMCSSLQVLTLEGLNAWEDDLDTEPPKDFLPKLQRVNVQTTPIQEAESFLFQLPLPQSAKLRLAVDVHEELASLVGPGDAWALPDFNFPPNPPACVQDWKRFEIIWDEATRAVFLRGYRNAEDHVDPDLEVEFANANSLNVIPPPEHWPFDFGRVEVLVLQMGKGDDVQYDQWDILKDFSNVKRFRLTAADHRSVISLVRALARTENLTPPAGQPWSLCPRLRTLELFNFKWTERFSDGLKEMIRTRKQKGSMLQSVEISGATKGPEGQEMHVAWSDEEPPFVVNLHADA